MSLVEESLQELEEKRSNILSGKVNCIPSPFERFNKDYVGVEQETFYVVTSFTKGGKTQFSSFTYLYQPLLYAYYHPETGINVTVQYFALEESPKRIMQRFMSWLLNYYTHGLHRISPRDLRSVQTACPEEAIELLKNDEIQDILKYFEDHVTFSTTPNPTGILKEIVDYAKSNGTEIKKPFQTKDEFGNTIEIEKFEKYIPNDPSEYHIVFLDNANNIEVEKGCLNVKAAIDKVSTNLRKVRNRYRYIPVVIQQQAFETEGNEAFKLGKMRPSVAGLGDSKYVSRDANVVLGLFSPARFGLKEYYGYDITKFKDSIRFLEVCINRDGEMGGLIALYFDGATCTFKELPPSSDKEAMKSWYNYLERLSKSRVNLLYKLKKFIIHG